MKKLHSLTLAFLVLTPLATVVSCGGGNGSPKGEDIPPYVAPEDSTGLTMSQIKAISKAANHSASLVNAVKNNNVNETRLKGQEDPTYSVKYAGGAATILTNSLVNDGSNWGGSTLFNPKLINPLNLNDSKTVVGMYKNVVDYLIPFRESKMVSDNSNFIWNINGDKHPSVQEIKDYWHIDYYIPWSTVKNGNVVYLRSEQSDLYELWQFYWSHETYVPANISFVFKDNKWKARYQIMPFSSKVSKENVILKQGDTESVQDMYVAPKPMQISDAARLYLFDNNNLAGTDYEFRPYNYYHDEESPFYNPEVASDAVKVKDNAFGKLYWDGVEKAWDASWIYKPIDDILSPSQVKEFNELIRTNEH